MPRLARTVRWFRAAGLWRSVHSRSASGSNRQELSGRDPCADANGPQPGRPGVFRRLATPDRATCDRQAMAADLADEPFERRPGPEMDPPALSWAGSLTTAWRTARDGVRCLVWASQPCCRVCSSARRPSAARPVPLRGPHPGPRTARLVRCAAGWIEGRRGRLPDRPVEDSRVTSVPYASGVVSITLPVQGPQPGHPAAQGNPPCREREG